VFFPIPVNLPDNVFGFLVVFHFVPLVETGGLPANIYK
jgi:hypothetical protein